MLNPNYQVSPSSGNKTINAVPLQDLTEVSFKELMDRNQLDKELQSIIKTVLTMKNDECPASDAVTSLRQFVVSAGKYGDTPFLWTLAGCGEIPQAFCRLSAVFGGTYCLGSSPTHLQFAGDQSQFDFKGCQKKSRFVVGSISSVPVDHLNDLSSTWRKSSHVACLTSKSLTQLDEGRVRTSLFFCINSSDYC